MSKISKKPIIIPDGVTVKINNRLIEVTGKTGSLSLRLLEYINLEINGNQAIFKPSSMHKQARANWGTITSLLKNAIQGVTEGFFKIIEIEGVGYRASMEGNTLVLSVGFTKPVKYTAPESIKITVDKTGIKIAGIDRQLVGQVAAQIRKIKKPEPYKGKGIHYQGEVIRRKAGKKVAGATAAS